MKKLILSFTIFTHIFIFSQNDLEDFLNNVVQESLHDSEILLEGYMSPLGAVLGSGLNGGWYNTAKSHSLGGFDVTAGLHIISIPNSAETFNPSNDFNQFQIQGNQNIPTFVGPENTNSQIIVPGNDSFLAPVGTDLPAIPVPYFQGSIGGPKKTDILFRLSPFKLDFGNMKFGYWGVGFKHDLLQWIPIAKKIPVDLSYLISYSKLTSTFNFYGDKNLDFKVRGLNQYLCLSKKLSFITLYSGVGYHFSNSRLKLNGDFVVDPNGEQVTISNPFDFNFGGVNGFKTDVGVRMKILVFALHAQWTRAEYNMFTFGVGLSTDGLY